MSQPHATLRLRTSIFEGEPPHEYTPNPYDEETSAITQGKAVWPMLCDWALHTGLPHEITVIDRQGQVCWERRAPLRLERDHAMDEATWVLHVLRQQGPLSTPQIETLTDLKRSAVRACLTELEAQGRITRTRRALKHPTSRGRGGAVWDIKDV